MKLRRALGTTFVLQAVAMACATVFQLLVARWLGAHGRGEFALLVSASQILAMIAGLGLPGAISYYAASVPTSVPVLARREFKLLAVVALALVPVLSMNRSLGWLPVVEGIEVWFATYTIVSIAQPAFASLTLAMGSVAVSNGTAVVPAVGSLVVVIALKHFARLDVSRALGAVAASTLMGTALAVAHMAQKGALKRTGERNPTLRQQLEMAGLGFTSNVLGLLMFRVDIFLVAALAGGTKAAGLYSIGVLAAEILVRVPNWTATVLAPAVSARKLDARAATITLFWANVLFVGVACVPVVLMPGTMRWLIGRVMGAEYVEAYAVLLAIVPRILAQSGGAILFGNLAGRGYTLYHPLACGAGLAMLVASDLVLIPRLGLVGAAIGSGIGYVAATGVAFKGFLVINELDVTRFWKFSIAESSRWRQSFRDRVRIR